MLEGLFLKSHRYFEEITVTFSATFKTNPLSLSVYYFEEIHYHFQCYICHYQFTLNQNQVTSKFVFQIFTLLSAVTITATVSVTFQRLQRN